MLFTIVLAVLAAALTVCAVVLLQALRLRAAELDLEKKRKVTELARTTGGVVSPPMVAEHLRISAFDADRILRSMVDDVHLRMTVDDREGVLKFWFTQLSEGPEEDSEKVPLGRSSVRRRRPVRARE